MMKRIILLSALLAIAMAGQVTLVKPPFYYSTGWSRSAYTYSFKLDTQLEVGEYLMVEHENI